MKTIYEEFAINTGKQIAMAHDDLVFSWLEPYGVTRENFEEYIPRLGICELSDQDIQHWHLDGRYLFSVEMIQEWDSPTSMTLYYRKFHKDKEFDPEQED